MSSKVIVRSIPLPKGGKVGYIVPNTRELINSRRPSLVTNCPFVNELIAEGKLELLATKLPMEATDIVLADYLAESGDDVELGVAAFVALFGDNTVEQPQRNEQPTQNRNNQNGRNRNRNTSK